MFNYSHPVEQGLSPGPIESSVVPDWLMKITWFYWFIYLYWLIAMWSTLTVQFCNTTSLNRWTLFYPILVCTLSQRKLRKQNVQKEQTLLPMQKYKVLPCKSWLLSYINIFVIKILTYNNRTLPYNNICFFWRQIFLEVCVYSNLIYRKNWLFLQKIL